MCNRGSHGYRLGFKAGAWGLRARGAPTSYILMELRNRRGAGSPDTRHRAIMFYPVSQIQGVHDCAGLRVCPGVSRSVPGCPDSPRVSREAKEYPLVSGVSQGAPGVQE